MARLLPDSQNETDYSQFRPSLNIAPGLAQLPPPVRQQAPQARRASFLGQMQSFNNANTVGPDASRSGGAQRYIKPIDTEALRAFNNANTIGNGDIAATAQYMGAPPRREPVIAPIGNQPAAAADAPKQSQYGGATLPGLPGSTIGYEHGVQAGLVPTIGPRRADMSSPAYWTGDQGQVPQAPGAYVNGQPIALRNDSEVGQVGQINQDFLSRVAPSFLGNRNAFQSPEAARIAAAGPRTNTGPTTIEGRERAAAQQRATAASATDAAATRQTAENIARINAQAQAMGAQAKAALSSGRTHAEIVPELVKAAIVDDGTGRQVFDQELFNQTLQAAGIAAPQPQAEQPADLNGDGQVSQDEARVSKAEQVMKLARSGDPRITDALRVEAEAVLARHRQAVKKASGLGP